jgi:hypothetical protein
VQRSKRSANEEGVIRLLKPGKKCKKGQKAVSWNQEGPAGAKGVAGAPGAAGPSRVAGPPGAAGTNGAPAPGATEWASLSKAGAIIAGRGVVSATEVAGPAFQVTFDRDVSKCGAVVTSNFTAAEPRATVESGGVVTMQFTTNNGVTPVGEPGTVAVFC